jgi:hypothetical protein
LDSASELWELPKDGNNSVSELFTSHFGALCWETNLLLSRWWHWQDEEITPLLILKAFTMLDRLFPVKLDTLSFGTIDLAQIYAARGETRSAEACYREALRSCVESERLKIQIPFSEFLMKIERQEDAIFMLVSEYTSYLSNRWPITGIIAAEFVCFRELFHLDQNALGSLDRMHSKTRPGSTFSVCTSLSRLSDVGQSMSKDNTEKVLLEFMRLGAAYSEISWLNVADIIYGFAAPRLAVFNSRAHAFERACLFRDLAKYNKMRGSPEDQLKHLKTAFLCIAVVHLSQNHRIKDLAQLQDETFLFLDYIQFWRRKEFFLSLQPGPLEAQFESLAREDPLLSRWMLGEPFESALPLDFP